MANEERSFVVRRASEEKAGQECEEIKHRKHSDLTPANSILHIATGVTAAKKVRCGTKGTRDETTGLSIVLI